LGKDGGVLGPVSLVWSIGIWESLEMWWGGCWLEEGGMCRLGKGWGKGGGRERGCPFVFL
jgi:hypothetical protein